MRLLPVETDQGQACQICRRGDAQAGIRHGSEAVGEQGLRDQAGIGAATIADGDVDRRGSQVGKLVAGLQLQVDAGMLAAEIAHARHQPLHGERIGGGDADLNARARLRQSGERRLERIEPVTQHRKQLRARFGQRHLAHLSVEQRQPGLRFQGANLMADGGWRYRQFGGGGLEAAQAGGGFEGA
ncbi:hypothetical protein D3C87_1406330 [compost metagenome]